ncbi:MAG: O-acetyl-ADP-ribose deacetylase [Mycobacteriales bacterium]
MPSISCVLGDITTQQVDAIVNAANSSLLGGGGVDGAIHAAGGPEILEACGQLRRTVLVDGLPAGSAVATTGGRLPAAHVIHVVGPQYPSDPAQVVVRRPLLTGCYTEALRVADELLARSVAFPAVSAGVYGWPIEDAARTAVAAVRAADTAVVEVRFVLAHDRAYQAFQAALAAG